MISHAWLVDETEEGVKYSLQINEVPWKFKKALGEAMRDWKMISYGWNNKTGNQLFIYHKLFKNEEEWKKWATSFPLDVIEKRFWGTKTIEINYSKKAGKNAQK